MKRKKVDDSLDGGQGNFMFNTLLVWRQNSMGKNVQLRDFYNFFLFMLILSIE